MVLFTSVRRWTAIWKVVAISRVLVIQEWNSSLQRRYHRFRQDLRLANLIKAIGACFSVSKLRTGDRGLH